MIITLKDNSGIRVNIPVQNISYFCPAVDEYSKAGNDDVQSVVKLHHEERPLKIIESCEEICDMIMEEK